MAKQIISGNMEIEHESAGLQGRPCVTISLGPRGDIKLRLSLEDAENIGEALIQCVRRAEETAEH